MNIHESLRINIFWIFMNCKINIREVQNEYSEFSIFNLFFFLIFISNIHDILTYSEVFMGIGFIFIVFRVQYISPHARNISECDEWQEYSFKYSSYFLNILKNIFCDSWISFPKKSHRVSYKTNERLGNWRLFWRVFKRFKKKNEWPSFKIKTTKELKKISSMILNDGTCVWQNCLSWFWTGYSNQKQLKE